MGGWEAALPFNWRINLKKLFALLLILVSCSLFAQEQVLFDATAKPDLDGYDYVSNFEIISE